MTEELNELCKKYGFLYDIIGWYIRVYSKRDTWYFFNKDYKIYEKIKLLHANSYGGAGTHRQRGEFNNIYEVFNYIDNHDKREIMKQDKVCRIAEKLKIIYH
jgi:hypothetical protein